jgi:hypothetical protein
MFLIGVKHLQDVILNDHVMCCQQVQSILLRKLPDTSELGVGGHGYAYSQHIPTVQLEWRKASR